MLNLRVLVGILRTDVRDRFMQTTNCECPQSICPSENEMQISMSLKMSASAQTQKIIDIFF